MGKEAYSSSTKDFEEINWDARLEDINTPENSSPTAFTLGALAFTLMGHPTAESVIALMETADRNAVNTVRANDKQLQK